MDRFALFGSAHTVSLLQRIYMLLDTASSRAGDMCLEEYALLLYVAEASQGVPVKAAPLAFRCVDARRLVEQLERKELVEKERHASDKRRLALRLTSKGKARISLVDAAMGSTLVAAVGRLSEEALEHLVRKMHAVPAAQGEERLVDIMFPAEILTALCDFHAMAVEESTRYGMTLLQAALMCQLDARGPASVAVLAEKVGALEDIVAFQAEDLERKGLVSLDFWVENTERGAARVADLFGRMAVRLKKSWAQATQEHLDALDDLGEYCLHVFA